MSLYTVRLRCYDCEEESVFAVETSEPVPLDEDVSPDVEYCPNCGSHVGGEMDLVEEHEVYR